jgi:hypothetical protein
MDPISSPRTEPKSFNRFFSAIIAVQIFIGVVALSLLGGAIYVACHFLAKIW